MYDLFTRPRAVETRWVSFENPAGAKGAAARRNKGAKGYPCETIHPGQTMTLMDVRGQGIITRVWMTVQNRYPRMLREMRLDMYWDGARTPAVSAPLADLFGFGLARMATVESELFASPEGRSFNLYAPMPFRTFARVTLTNESADSPNLLFYDVDYLLMDSLPQDALYFHAAWRRENPTVLGRDFEVLQTAKGAGRFLGCCVGVVTDPVYEDSWWGEGEVKIYLDGDKENPTLCGTGTEDYIGTGWGQKVYSQRFQGCTVADPSARQWAFYRLHIPDPVFFSKDCRVTLQQIGGAEKDKVRHLIRDNHAPLTPITVGAENADYARLLDEDPPASMDDRGLPNGWTNFYRRDDVSACAWFYLDTPENNLAPLASKATRTAGTEASSSSLKAGGVEA